MSADISQEVRKAIAALQLVIQAEEITIPTAARLLKKPQRWVRENLPVIIHSHKSHHVRLSDVEAYQERRTVWPKFERRTA